LFVSQKKCNFAVVNELKRHIEILLLDNDCVIVPDFGGFVTHYVSARYDENDNVFLPPSRTLGFNPQLRINDSLLVQSYVTAYDISYPEALRRIESEVEELQQTLRTEGRYVMDDIGTLTINSDGNYEFEPCEAGVLSPELYGFGSFGFLRLKDSRNAKPQLKLELQGVQSQLPVSQTQFQDGQNQQEDGPALLEFTESSGDGERAIEIKMSWIRNAVAVAAAIVAFFLMATPIANSDMGTSTMSNLQISMLQKLMPKDSNMTPAQPIATVLSKDSIKEETAKEDVVKEETKTAEPETIPTTRYCIVLASQVKMSNAENFVEQLHKRGFNDAEVYVHKKTVRVICGSFETEAEAYRRINQLAGEKDFAEAWVYKRVES
jgi:hypothetical protein